MPTPTNSSWPPLSQIDIKDPSLTRLNQRLSWVWGRISLFILGSNNASITSTVPFSAPNFTATAAPAGSVDLPPTQVLTKAQGDALYGAQVLAAAFASGQYNNQPVQLPIPAGTASGVNMSGAHTIRLATAAVLGATFFETDRSVLYEAINTGYGIAWSYVTGVMVGTTISVDQRPSLGGNDTNFQFYSTDALLLYRWNGAAWTLASVHSPLIVDTYANFTTANYPTTRYTAGTEFLISDWNVKYIVSGSNWLYDSGVYIAVAASRPTTGFDGAALGTHDTGLFFLASDTVVLEYWTGAAWVTLSGALTQAITTPTAQLQFGGASVGMTGTFTCSCVQTGKNVLLSIFVQVTAKGSSTGSATVLLGTIPGVANAGVGAVAAVGGMVGLTSPIHGYIGAGTNYISLVLTGATGDAALADTNFGVGTPTLTLTITYQST